MTMHVLKTSKAELLNSTSQAALLIGDVMQKVQNLDIPMTHELSEEQLAAIASVPAANDSIAKKIAA